MIRGLYIHIPFCESICHYCDFPKMVANPSLQKEYIHHLLLEFDSFCNRLGDLRTIYIGGGTPSFLQKELLEELLAKINQSVAMDQIEEFTIEANPNDVDQAFANLIGKGNVNRVSLGVQSFQNDTLEILGRKHRKEDVKRAVQILRDAGISNLSMDMMVGNPSDTKEKIMEDVDYLLTLQPDHIAYYSLILEPKTQFAYDVNKGKLKFPSEDAQMEMENTIQTALANNGYLRYEISNYARMGKKSLHNLLYWNLEAYLGLGMGASSQYDNQRMTNHKTFKKYLESVKTSGTGIAIYEPFEPELETILLGLRKTEGIDMEQFQEKFQISVLERFPELKQHIENALLEIIGSQLAFSPRGLDLANQVWLSLF